MALLAILPLFTVGLTFSFTDVNAAKSSGTPLLKFGSDTNVCGLQLCSEIPGGKDAWIASQSLTTTLQSGDSSMKDMESEQEIFEHVIEMPDDDHMKDMKHSDKDHMSKDHADSYSTLKLSRANVPATIPLHHGYYNGGDVFFIITDSSDSTHADIISENQGWKVELAPLLSNAPDSALSPTYMFTNGVEGDGVHGYQSEVFTSTPAQPETYSALTSHVHVTWNDDSTPRILDSEDMILAAEENGELVLTDLDVVMNMPHIIWPDGQMIVKEDKTLTDETPYGGGQILDIDTEEMTVTFIAHRGWGPDGRTIYYIVTDATPSGPANMMGVVDAPTSAELIANSAAVDLFQFKNGLKGSGPLGFQPGIAAAAPGDANYSPMWRIFLIDWNNEHDAKLLETVGDINAYSQSDMITISIAKPMDSHHIVNCPFIDPFQ